MTYPGMAFVFVVGVGLATILYYMFADSNDSHQHNAHGSDGGGPSHDTQNSWSSRNSTRRQRRKVSNSSDKTNDCTICLMEILQHFVVIQPCGHSFHEKCIQEWQLRGQMVPTCPNCRRKIEEVITCN